MEEYYKYLGEWKKTTQEAVKEVYCMVSKMPDSDFAIGGDWVNGYKRDLAKSLTEKVVSPYNFFRDRKLMDDMKNAVVFKSGAGKKVDYGEPEHLPAGAHEGEKEEKEQLGWGPEGTATDKGDTFDIVYNDGREATIDKKVLKEKTNKDGLYYTTRINDTPTNIFPRDDAANPNLWNVHEYKVRP